jgi:outer membrane protein
MSYATGKVIGILLILLSLTGITQANESVAINEKNHHWIIRGGVTNINPKTNNGNIVSLGDRKNLTTTITYLYNENIGIELLAGLAFKHNIYDKALGTGLKIASASHLPPTVTFQYYFRNNTNLTPYIGLGLNHTFFFKEKTTGPLAGADLKIGSSTDFAFQLGADWFISDRLTLNFDVRKFKIKNKATVTNIGNSSLSNILPEELVFDVPIDPITLGIHLVWHF